MAIEQLLSEAQKGRLDHEDWNEAFYEIFLSPDFSNERLLEIATQAGSGLEPSGARAWMNQLLECALYGTQERPDRLALCQQLLREGLADFDHPRRWEDFGGLLHLACEGASLEALRWVAARDPECAHRPGGLHGLTPFHCLCNRTPNDSDEITIPIARFLITLGLHPDARTLDQRNALYRCVSPGLAGELIRLGSNPWMVDAQGLSLLGYWLEMGLHEQALMVFKTRPGSINQPLSMSSDSAFSRSATRLSTPRHGSYMERPLFILAGSPFFLSHPDFPAALSALVRAGADALSRDRLGRSLIEACPHPAARSLYERALLESTASDAQGRSGRRL